MITITLDVELALLQDDTDVAVSTEYRNYKLKISGLTLEEWKQMEEDEETQEFLIDVLWEQCRVYPFMGTVKAEETNVNASK